jgi:hypothetical protein
MAPLLTLFASLAIAISGVNAIDASLGVRKSFVDAERDVSHASLDRIPNR